MKKSILIFAIFITKLATAASGIGVVALRYDKSRNMSLDEYRALIKSYSVPGFITADNTLLYNTAILNSASRAKIVDATRIDLVNRFNAIHQAKGVTTIVTLANLDYYLSLCTVLKNSGQSRWSLIYKSSFSSGINDVPRNPYTNEDVAYYMGEKVCSLMCGNVNGDIITTSSYEEGIKKSSPPAAPTSGTAGTPPPAAPVAGGSTPPPAPISPSCTTCPPAAPASTCGNCTSPNSELLAEIKRGNDINEKLLKATKFGNGVAIANAALTGGHWIWDMATGKQVWVASNGNGGGINPNPGPGGGGPYSWGGGQ